MKDTLVMIEWEDPASTGGWQDRAEAIEAARSHDRTCRTVGWIVHQDDELIVLAGSIGCAAPPQIGDIFEVPRRVIERIVYLSPTHTDVTGGDV